MQEINGHYLKIKVSPLLKNYFSYQLIDLISKIRYVFFSVPVNMMGITYAILAQGSAFLHGSQTRNGGAADVVLNNLFAYVAYQAVVENLEQSNNPMIHDLSLTPR